MKGDTYAMTADASPAFLYKTGVYDPLNLKEGLLRGYLPVRVSLDLSLFCASYVAFTGVAMHSPWSQLLRHVRGT